MDYTVHGILQARILEWVAVPSSRGSSQSRDWTQSPTLQVDSLPAEPPGKPKKYLESLVCASIVVGPEYIISVSRQMVPNFMNFIV